MTHSIMICMGSSCFARGNADNLAEIESFIDEHDLKADIALTGARCCNQCTEGPHIVIDEKPYHHVDAGKLQDILQHTLLPAKGEN